MNSSAPLYVVAVPIGHPDDITIRAINILKSVDCVICEDAKEGSRLLKQLGITEKTIYILNEHNEQEQAADLVIKMHLGNSMALISDCGTPVFSDPGHYLIQHASELGIKIVPIPGPSSLMAALSILDFNLGKFVFGGFLGRDPDERRRELFSLKSYRMPVVLMDTPYRLSALLDDVGKVFGKNHAVTLACDLTLPKETIYRGTVAEVLSQVNKKKAEFILIVHASPTRR
jgi:16S rRNA (cytidine1402-2'-O)-methyltransferase